MLQKMVDELHGRLSAQQYTKILTFGSSNTERIDCGAHWSDVLDLGLGQKFGRQHRLLNMGIGGNTTRDLLGRIQRDVLDYAPDFVIITIGGNDSNPDRQLSKEEFRESLIKIKQMISARTQNIVFQTYYAPNPKLMSPKHFENFNQFMSVVREVAYNTNSGLLDPLPRWEALRASDHELFVEHMRDGMHLNPLGNATFGLDLARQFGVLPNMDTFWTPSRLSLALMDELLAKKS